MARCEDYPCCGHELGCCPDYDEGGNQLNMKCTCGATLPLNNSVSICDGCLRQSAIDDGDYPDDYFDRDDEPDEDDEADAERNADILLERQELEDFERADEYYGREDYGDFDGPFCGE